MNDFSALAARVRDARSSAGEEEAAGNAQRSAAPAPLRSAIGIITSDVLPRLEAAKRELEREGVILVIEPLWAPEKRPKRPAVAIYGRLAGDWPAHLRVLRGDLAEIQHGPTGLGVVTKPVTDPDVVGEPVPCAPGSEVSTAVECAVASVLSRAARGPRMKGIEVRQSRPAPNDAG